MGAGEGVGAGEGEGLGVDKGKVSVLDARSSMSEEPLGDPRPVCVLAVAPAAVIGLEPEPPPLLHPPNPPHGKPPPLLTPGV